MEKERVTSCFLANNLTSKSPYIILNFSEFRMLGITHVQQKIAVFIKSKSSVPLFQYSPLGFKYFFIRRVNVILNKKNESMNTEADNIPNIASTISVSSVFMDLSIHRSLQSKRPKYDQRLERRSRPPRLR